MDAFLASAILILLAELGDKTQLMALAFATRYRAREVLGGILAATLLLNLLAAVAGQLLGLALPLTYIQFLAGIAFIGFGIWTLRGEELGGEPKKRPKFGPFLTVALTFFLAELGDKTQLATVSLAAKYSTSGISLFGSFGQVWLGATLGMVVADGLAIVIGSVMGKKLPEKLIRWIAAGIFIIFGVVTLVRIWV